MSILDVTSAVITTLRAAGADSADPAPWGDRVHLRQTSDVVEISGADAGEPKAVTWPVLFLFGPAVRRQKAMSTPGARFLQNYNGGARSIQKRTSPRFYVVSFRVVWQTRSGFGTGTGGTATTAQAQLLAGITRFERWIAAHGAFGEGVLFTTRELGAATSGRPTPADVLEATGEIRVEYVQEFLADPVTVPSDNALVPTIAASRTLP